MGKAIAGTEVLLTVGILIAVGVTLVELKGVFYGQEVLTQEEVVVQFSRDLENTVDRAISTTGDVAFVYYPRVKNYRVTISSTEEKKEVKPVTEEVKKEFAREIYKGLNSPIACVQNDVCSNKQKFGESSYSSELSELNLDEAVRNAISKMTDIEITSYSMSDVEKNEINIGVDFCTVESITITQYDFTIDFVTSLGEEFTLSSLDISSSMFDIKYAPLATNQLKTGEVFSISDADLELKSVGRIYALKIENISGPITYANGRMFVKNLDDHEKKCRSGIYCGADCGAITFGHFEYIFKPSEQLALDFHPTASEGDFIIFCDDGSFAKKHINFFSESQEEKPKSELPAKKIVSVVTIYDKVSRKSAGFSKSEEIVKNVFEDAEKIWIIKRQNKVYILGKCAGNGSSCFNSLGCCSGSCWGGKNSFVCQENCAENDLPAGDSESCCSKFLDESTGLCSNPPICPEKSACNGAPEDGIWKDINNTDCCPGDRPLCSNKHCCPTDKPRYCKKTKDGQGEPRCMSEDDYKTKCYTDVFHFIYVPLGYGSDEFATFKSKSDSAYNDFMSKTPFKDCSDGRDRTEVHYVDPKDCQKSCSYMCTDCQRVGLDCTRAVFGSQMDSWDMKIFVLYKGQSITCDSSGGQCYGCASGIPPTYNPPALTSVSCAGCGGAFPAVVTHEVGHCFGLCHECGLARLPSGCPNPDVQNNAYVMCYGSQQYFSPASYSFLKNDETWGLGKFTKNC